MRGGAKSLRKCALQLSQATHSGFLEYMNLPAKTLVEINNEVAEEWRRKRNSNLRSKSRGR